MLSHFDEEQIEGVVISVHVEGYDGTANLATVGKDAQNYGTGCCKGCIQDLVRWDWSVRQSAKLVDNGNCKCILQLFLEGREVAWMGLCEGY